MILLTDTYVLKSGVIWIDQIRIEQVSHKLLTLKYNLTQIQSQISL